MYTFLVSGDREWNNPKIIQDVFTEIFGIHGREVTLIHGGCRGLDLLAGSIAKDMGWNVIQVDADWKKYGRGAGPIRNRQMLEMKPQHLHAFHNHIHSSKGTKNCIDQAIKMNIPWTLHSRKSNESKT